MNREQRRKVKKDAKAKGISEKLTDLYLSMDKHGLEKPTAPVDIRTGDKVKVDVDKVKARRNYNAMSEPYKQFVEGCGGRVFTANVEQENLVSMQEEPTWLFWSGDLIVVERCGDAEETKG